MIEGQNRSMEGRTLTKEHLDRTVYNRKENLHDDEHEGK